MTGTGQVLKRRALFDRASLNVVLVGLTSAAKSATLALSARVSHVGTTICTHILLMQHACRTPVSVNFSIPRMHLDTSLLGRRCDENFYSELKQCVPCGDCEVCSRMLYTATAVFVLLFTLSILFMPVSALNHLFSVMCYLQVPVALSIRASVLQPQPRMFCVSACTLCFSHFVLLG